MFHWSLWTFQVALIIFSMFANSSKSVYTLENTIQSSQGLMTGIEVFNNTENDREPILDYRGNGIRLVIRFVSYVNNSSSDEEDGRFPTPPIRDLIHCVMNVSTLCIENKTAKYIDTVGCLDEITLFGSRVKFVKILNRLSRHQTVRSLGEIDRSINDFFDKFALRIILPGWNKRNEQIRIDFMFDDSNSIEGRGKGGGGGIKGGGGGGCKQMMMCMMMALKMNMMGMMGLMILKGLMMSGMFLMMIKSIILMKFMEPNRSGNSGAQIKKIIVLTKGYSGSSHGPSSHANYGDPPSSPSGSEHYSSSW